ncbi:MAG: hypothetical protein ACYS26_02770 [Planctomycetota bacterium]
MGAGPSRLRRLARAIGCGLLGCAVLSSCRTTQSGDLDDGGFSDPTPRWDPYAYRRDDGWEERGFLLIGERGFQDSLLSEADSQLMIGLELSGRPEGAWLDLEFGLLASANSAGPISWWEAVFGGADETADGSDLFSGTSATEFSLGVRKQLPKVYDLLVGYAGVGVTALRLRDWDLDSDGFKDDTDGGLGMYGHVGVYADFQTFGSPGRLGFDLRAVEGVEVDLGFGASSADYVQWAFTFSFFL